MIIRDDEIIVELLHLNYQSKYGTSRFQACNFEYVCVYLFFVLFYYLVT